MPPAFLLAAAVVLAQPPDLSGTWKLDESRSRVAAEAPFAGLIGVGAPGTLHVAQPRNGSLVVESQINESHVRVYRPGETTTTPVFVGPPGDIVMTSKWDGQKLVSEGRRDSAERIGIRETVGLSPDGQTLQIEITTTGPDGKATSSLRYTRIRSVGACDSWPSPCKKLVNPGK